MVSLYEMKCASKQCDINIQLKCSSLFFVFFPLDRNIHLYKPNENLKKKKSRENHLQPPVFPQKHKTFINDSLF